MPKRFTLEEARRILPEVSGLLREAVSVKAGYEEAENSFQALTQKVMLRGGMAVDRERALDLRSRRDRCAQHLKRTLEKIQETGCLIKDLDTGLVDFPTLFRGEEVYLCWKLDEPDITFWHGVDEGFAGRKTIDQDFLEHHSAE